MLSVRPAATRRRIARPRLAALADEFFDWMREVDRRFSTFKANSEICRLDRGELTLADCSPDLLHTMMYVGHLAVYRRPIRDGPIRRRYWLGGLLKDDHREAA